MRAGRPLALALLLLASWSAQAQADGPVETAVKFHEAQGGHRCKEAWALSSKGRQEKIRSAARKRAQEGGRPPQDERPEESCARVGKLMPGTARLELKVGDEAVVSARFKGAAPRDQYDLKARFAEYDEELDLVREGGAWKVEWPRVKRQSSHAILRIGIGAVDWRMEPIVRGLHYKHELTVSTRVPRDALESVLLDPNAWANLLPSIKSVEPLERTGGVERARLSFAEPSTPITVLVKRSGRPVDPAAGWISIEWVVEKDVDAPIYMRGAWALKPNPDGTTQVNLTLVLNPRHWPDHERQFSAAPLGRSLGRLADIAADPKLLREDGTRKVDPPRAPSRPPPRERRAEVGPVDVYQGAAIAGLLQKMEATAIVPVPRDSLDAVLRDSAAWARALPSFTSIEPLERTGELDRARITLGSPGRAVTISFRRHGRVGGDQGATSSQLRWDPEGGNKAPIYLRGGWKVDTVPGGSRVTLDLFIDPQHWPADAADGMFSAERLANAVFDLEKAALKKP